MRHHLGAPVKIQRRVVYRVQERHLDGKAPAASQDPVQFIETMPRSREVLEHIEQQRMIHAGVGQRQRLRIAEDVRSRPVPVGRG